MTATSGPGWCLMIETVQYAVMTETPVVVTVVQRLGPSTGGATQGAQGDVLLTEFCTSGGYTIPVFAPASAVECYELARRAFEWSERLRTPVVLLSDKEVGMTLETVDLAALSNDAAPVSDRQPFPPSAGRFAPYFRPCAEEPPGFAPVGGECARCRDGIGPRLRGPFAQELARGDRRAGGPPAKDRGPRRRAGDRPP